MPAAPVASSRQPLPPVSPTPRRLDHEHIPRLQLRAVRAGQDLVPPTRAFHPLPSDRAVVAALPPARRPVAPRPHDHRRHLLQEPDPPDRAIAATPASIAT